MRTTEEFLSILRRLHVKVWADGESLRFSAPKGVMSAELRAELAARKAQVLAFLSEASGSLDLSDQRIQRMPRDVPVPLSFAQERLWFLEQLEPGTPAYNIPAVLRLAGKLDVKAVERSLSEIVRRHEVLRTTFPIMSVGSVQLIAPPSPDPHALPLIDLRHLKEPDQSAEVRRLIDAEAPRPFDVATGPLLRATLLRLGEESHVMLVTMHHIVSDGWSMGIFIRELGMLYEAYAKGLASPLEELAIQYADFAHWQRERLTGKLLDSQLQYWKRQLAGAPSLLKLPNDNPRPPVQSYRAATEHFEIDGGLTRRLKNLGELHGATLFMTLLAGYVALLSRYSGQRDILVGSPIANRNRTELEQLIGFFINTLVLRIDLTREPTFADLLDRVRQVALAAYAHQDLPFERLVAELQPERSLSYSPLFQAMFILQNNPVGKLEIPGLRDTSLEMDVGVVRCDLSLSIEETDSGLKGLWTYKPELFDAGTIKRMSRRLQSLLGSAVHDPTVAVADLSTGERLDLPTLSGSVPSEEKTPLSYHQERLWFIDQFETANVYKENPVYHNIPVILHLNGHVDEGLLEESLNAILERHDALRTRIVSENGMAFQEVRNDETLKLKVVDASDESIESAVELCLTEARGPLVLDRDLLVRATLFRVTATEALLLIVVHHIIADRSSTRLILKELAEIHDARSQGREPNLAEAAIQYADYTRWQRSLPAEALESLLFYWKHQLGEKLPALELPTARPRPAVHTFTDARHAFRLDQQLAGRIKKLGEEKTGGELVVLLAGFKALLRRYCRQDTIVIGITEPGRNQSEAKNLIGPIANLLVLRSELTGKTTFRRLTAQLDRTLSDARAHREMPFDKLVLELNPEKDMSRTALFDVLFEFNEQDSPGLEMGALKASLIDTANGYGKYDIHLALRREGNELTGTAVYNADIYDAFAIEQMMRHFQVLLDYLVREPDSHVDDVTLLSEAEQHQQLEVWNSTAAAYPAATLDQLFAQQVERTPESIAVVCGDEQLTYRELDARANQLAHHLKELGAAPDVLVGVCLARSVELIVALLGILKAGAAYLPLEPSFPVERRRFMTENAGVSHLITTNDLLDSAAEKVTHVILLDTDREKISAQPTYVPQREHSPRNLAYCIYTSGSTGEPKGALIEHRNVVRLLINDRSLFGFTQQDIWCMFHSSCFDFSVWEMYGALLYGGKLIIVPTEVTKDPQLFLDLLSRERVTVLNQTPSAFYTLAQEALKHRSELALRYVIFGGEALQPARLKDWRDAYPEVRLVNMYGITETTVHVTFKEISDAEIQADESNIGKPISTTTAYVMDANLQLLPVGVPGEICVGGDGVGRGYLGRSELTAQKFLTNPYRPMERLYRSGDLAKLLPNGDMIYLGRLDDQVQVRGFRVELEEIRNHLLKHPGVAEAVVIALNGRSEMTEIAAYVVPSADISLVERKSFHSNNGDDPAHRRPLYELANGMEVFYQNKNETDFLYEEIFEQQNYFKHGVTLNDRDCVFDVGANIGLFTLFVSQACRDTTVYSFEPIPAIFETLRLNSELYGSTVKLFKCGLAREAGHETFTFYPNVSIFSGRFADSEKEGEIIKSFLLNQQEPAPHEPAFDRAELDELLRERLAAEPVVCELRSLSDVIRDHAVERIDLLKIDVEKSELDLLAGIDECDWPKIKQLVMEVHNVDGRLDRIRGIIEKQGFHLTIEQDDYFKDTSNYNLYAVRSAGNGNVAHSSESKLKPRTESIPKSSNRFVKELRGFLGSMVPDYMMPSAFVLLDKFPLTSGGKVDRRALPRPEQAGSLLEPALIAPRTPIEKQIASIWMEVLGQKQIGIHQNFFELGGHSLLATQVVSRLRDAFAVSLPVRSLFESPTIHGLADTIEKTSARRTESAEPMIVPVPREAHRAKRSLVEGAR